MVSKLIVIADDITGSNATGVLLRKQGWDVYSIPDSHADALQALDKCEAIVWNSASRLLSPAQASERIRLMLSVIAQERFIEKGWIIGKRIDSTLRGPVGAEIEAMLSVLQPDIVAVVVPAFPASGRITRGGSLFVNGVPVHQTEAGQDPFTPIHTSNVKELLEQQTSFPIAWIETGNYTDQELEQEVSLAAKENRIIICDAVSDAEIERLARVWARSGVYILPVDPGPFTACYAMTKKVVNNHILMVSGSLAKSAREQVDILEQNLPVGMVRIDLGQLCDSLVFKKYIEKVSKQVSDYMTKYQVIGLRSDISFTKMYDGAQTSQAIAELVIHLLSRYSFSGLYLSGGETAFATLSQMKVGSLQLLEEVVPLCVMARVVDGPYDGMRIVTKGGSVGDKMSILKSIQALLNPFRI
jgi:D-threonate/D-erythronate kinase